MSVGSGLVPTAAGDPGPDCGWSDRPNRWSERLSHRTGRIDVDPVCTYRRNDSARARVVKGAGVEPGVMSGEREPSTETQISTDPHTVRSWGETHELVPVRYERRNEERIDVVSRSEQRSDAEELSWEEFGDELSRQGKVAVRHGGEDVDVLDRSEAVGRVTVEGDDVESALMGGETVEAEVTETTVVEHTVVEEATVQSEVTDREVIESGIVDAELVATEVDHCSVTRASEPEETPEVIERFRTGTRTDEPYDVEIGVNELWALTREVVERITIESRIANTDVQGTETVESNTIHEEIDLDGVTQTVLAGELVASPEAATRAVEQEHVETRFREDDVVETRLVRRQTIDEELSVAEEITGEASEAETLSMEAVTHTVAESEIVAEDEYGIDLAAVGAGGAAAEASGVSGTGAVETPAEGTASAHATEETEGLVAPTQDDEGKTVVNAEGDEFGMVVDVEGDTMHVDPDPSITDRIRTALGWEDHDDDTYPVGGESIARIEDDRVVLDIDHEP